MKDYPRIAGKLYDEPWMISPSRWNAMHRQFQSAISGEQGGVVVEKEKHDDGIFAEEGTAIIRVHGIIGKHLSMIESMCGGYDLNALNEAIDSVESDASIKRVIFSFNTPGGTSTGVPETARKILGMSKQTVGFTDGESCSAGYWLMSQCGSCFATESSRTGSIGVWLARLDLTRQMEVEGVKIHSASAGRFKLDGAYWQPISEGEMARMKASVEKLHTQFKLAVNNHRSISPEIMEGQIFDGEEAFAAGLIDGVVDDITDIIDSE